MMYDGEACVPALPWEPAIYAASARANRLLELLSGMRGNYCPVRRMNYCPASCGIIVRYLMVRLLMGRGPTATRHTREPGEACGAGGDASGPYTPLFGSNSGNLAGAEKKAPFHGNFLYTGAREKLGATWGYGFCVNIPAGLDETPLLC